MSSASATWRAFVPRLTGCSIDPCCIEITSRIAVTRHLLSPVIPAKAGIQLLLGARHSRVLLAGIQRLGLRFFFLASLRFSARVRRAGHFSLLAQRKVTKRNAPRMPRPPRFALRVRE